MIQTVAQVLSSFLILAGVSMVLLRSNFALTALAAPLRLFRKVSRRKLTGRGTVRGDITVDDQESVWQAGSDEE